MKVRVKVLMISLLALFAFNSCKKSTVQPNNNNIPNLTTVSVKFTINGSVHTLTNVTQTSLTPPGLSTTETDIRATSTSGETFSIAITHASALKVGDSFVVSGSVAIGVGAYFSYNPDGGENAYVTQPAQPFGTVTITEVGSNYLKGDFSTKLYNFGDIHATNVVYTITDGQFYSQTGGN